MGADSEWASLVMACWQHYFLHMTVVQAAKVCTSSYEVQLP